MLTAKTMFNHSESQECGEWTPTQSGLDGWGTISPNTSQTKSPGETYSVSKLENGIQGPASSKKDMNLLYTCQLQNCIIHCPCSLCINEQCEENCEAKFGKKCRQQCKKHKLNLPWSFRVKTVHFTMVTNNTNYFKFATPYAGIPLNCHACSKDVLEHQILHLVVHLSCKFCSLEFRPFEKESIVTLGDFTKAERSMIKDENRTCSICFIKCKDRLALRRHAINKHKQKERKLKCDICNKSYFNKTSLKYHNETKHGTKCEYKCELCIELFPSSTELTKHKRISHIEAIGESQIKCRDCGKSFTILKSHQN